MFLKPIAIHVFNPAVSLVLNSTVTHVFQSTEDMFPYMQVNTPAVQSASYRCYEHMPFVRTASHLYAMHQLRQSNYFPAQIMASEFGPDGRAWNNFADCKHHYRVHYCHAEGYSRCVDPRFVTI